MQSISSHPSLRSIEFKHGERGLVAALDLGAGEIITAIHGREVTRPSRYTLQISEDLHIEPFEMSHTEPLSTQNLWALFNHHCMPNSYLQGRNMVALRDILAGEELCFNYNSTEFELEIPFECSCDAPGRKSPHFIRGFRYLPAHERTDLADYLADHLRSCL